MLFLCTMQVFHALFENIHVDYKYSPANQSARFAVYSVQIDNQLLSSTHPVVLCHSSSGNALLVQPNRKKHQKLLGTVSTFPSFFAAQSEHATRPAVLARFLHCPI